MSPGAVADLAQDSWWQIRPADAVETFPVSPGWPRDLIGTGLAEIAQRTYPDLRALERGDSLADPWHVIWISDEQHYALIDLADAMSWEGHGSPLGSSAFLGRDLHTLITSGVRRLQINLPQFMRYSDAGQGLLAALTGQDTTGADTRTVAQIIGAARQAISQLTVYVTYSAPMELAGFSGMAHSWAEQGLDPQLAQRAQQELGQWGNTVAQALDTMADRLLPGTPLATQSAYAGAGGGLAMMLEVLRARVLPIGAYLFGMYPETDTAISQSDLCCYIGGRIGVNIPSPLTELSDRAGKYGVPVVLVADAAGMRKGELQNLGVHGSYELRPELAFLEPQPDDPQSSAAITEKLAEQLQRVAVTWGY